VVTADIGGPSGTPRHLAGRGQRRLLAETRLPVTGWSARLYGGDGYWPMLYVQPAGGPPLISTLPQAVDGHLVLGAHHHPPQAWGSPGPARAEPPAALAYGAVPLSGPPQVTFLRSRPLLGPVRGLAEPVLLGELVWLAEARGRFTEVQVSAGPATVTRLL
jgi:hypothetical protein